ncbi:hypothetical protein [Sinomicrobium sp. M5D2P17]
MDTIDIPGQTLRELREIRKLLQEHFGQGVPILRQAQQQAGADLSDLVEVTWILRELGIGRTTFYKHVKHKLLFPKFRIGNRDYFDRKAVQNLQNK